MYNRRSLLGPRQANSIPVKALGPPTDATTEAQAESAESEEEKEHIYYRHPPHIHTCRDALRCVVVAAHRNSFICLGSLGTFQ